MVQLGKLLSGIRSGTSRSVWLLPQLAAPELLHVSSDDFTDGGSMPSIHSGNGVGANVSPQLAWSGAPPQTAQFLLIIEDTDVPFPRPLIHTVALLDASLDHIDRGALNAASETISFRKASFGRLGYQGPRPLPGHGPHHYGFNLYSLNRPLTSNANNLIALYNQVPGSVIARGRIIGVQER